MKAKLLSNDTATVVYELEVPAIPDNPEIIVYRGRGFDYAPSAFGPIEFLAYQEKLTLIVR